MFIKTNKKTGLQEVINSEAMVAVLESDVRENLIDDTLTDMVCGIYEHRNAVAIYQYKAA